jgi:hypothetical protein
MSAIRARGQHFGLVIFLLISARSWAVKQLRSGCCPVINFTEPSSNEKLLEALEKGSPRVLVGVVASTSPRTKTELMANIDALERHPVSWAVALYDGDDGSGMADVARYAGTLKVKFVAFDGRPHNETCPFCPKTLLQPSFIKYAEDVDYIALIDADISFAGFNWSRFWTSHHLAGSPHISIPLIRTNTQESNN